MENDSEIELGHRKASGEAGVLRIGVACKLYATRNECQWYSNRRQKKEEAQGLDPFPLLGDHRSIIRVEHSLVVQPGAVEFRT